MNTPYTFQSGNDGRHAAAGSATPRFERGAALLTAMIIVALVATLASSMLWQQWRAVQVESAERARAQATWILAGALDWARLILREDARCCGNVDHLGEPWAVPLAEARLSTFLAADKTNTDDAPDAFLSGAITDAQARYNLTDLIKGNDVDPLELAKLERLCQTVGIAADVADRIADGMRDAMPQQTATTTTTTTAAPASSPASAATPAPAAASAPSVSSTSADPPLLPQLTRQLVWFGIDPESVRLLEPYVVILPIATPVNVNTASREVLVAVIPGLDLATAERFTQTRQRSPFKAAPNDLQALAPALPTAAFNGVDVKSSFFEVRGRLRLADVVLEQRSLVQRRGLIVDVLQRERVSSRDLPSS